MRSRSLKSSNPPRVKHGPARKKLKKCELCAHTFHSRRVFDRFCWKCKDEDERIRFAEWLPELDLPLVDSLAY